MKIDYRLAFSLALVLFLLGYWLGIENTDPKPCTFPHCANSVTDLEVMEVDSLEKVEITMPKQGMFIIKRMNR